MSPDTAQRKRRVLLVDDHPVVRHGLGLLIDQEDDLMVCGESSSAVETLNSFTTGEPDIAVVDLSLQDSSGLELTTALKEIQPSLPILVLSMHDESLYAERALRAGARGYIMKEELTEKVVDAIHRIMDDMVYLSDKMSARLLDKFVSRGTEGDASPVDCLSDRELEVFQLLGNGYRTQEIAEKMHVSPKTIQSYRARIKDKLNLESSSELLQHAFQWLHDQKSS